MQSGQTFSDWFFAVAWLDVFKVVTDLLVGLGWPAAIVLIAYAFRHEIRKKFDDLETAGPSGVTFRPQQRQEIEKLEELRLVAENSRPAQKVVEARILADLEIIQENQRLPVLVHHLALARLGRHFEGIYWVIFGSQIEGLRRLQDAGGRTSLAQAEQYFEQVKAEYPDFYATITFTDWFRFLQTSQLAALEGTNVAITDMGQEFLIFVDETKAGKTRPH
ncbi:MAG: hypothetical protein E5W82_28920 [Mesorhizobium sp.]|nr:MAG: hypothetical protein E5W82_28920 [Mesorhizobium sp.]